MALTAPEPTKFAKATLEVESVEPQSLIRISRHNTKEPYFGKTGGNRFDDPRPIAQGKKYGTSYFGFSLHCAFAETVLHDEVIDHDIGGFRIAPSELDRYVLTFEGKPLKVAILCGVALKNLGGDGALSAITPYDIPQAWSLAVHQHKEKVDGFIYMSRHVNTERALVLFDRAKKKIRMKDALKFATHPDAQMVLTDFHIRAL